MKSFLMIMKGLFIGRKKYITAFGAVSIAASSTFFIDKTDASNQQLTYLDQGWSEEIRNLFYFTPQGSRMIPYDWFMALETPDGKMLFSNPLNMKRYGLVFADKKHALNPGNLPVGFAIDPKEHPETGKSLGLTCAACHSSDVTVKGERIRIDGNAAHFDFDMFYADLAKAVSRTFFDAKAFKRFAGRVLAAEAQEPRKTATDVAYLADHKELDTLAKLEKESQAKDGKAVLEKIARLRFNLAEFQSKIAGEMVVRHPSTVSGFGRVDALTQIINAISVTNQGDPYNLRANEAPTSYPHLWLTPRLEFVQWSPIVSNPIARNGGEVLGVFGETHISADTPEENVFASSILPKNLHAMETWLKDLEPPTWDEEIFGAIDQAKATQGATLYKKNCASCHSVAPYPQSAAEENMFGKTFIKIKAVDYRAVGTDPVYAESLAARIVRTNEVTAKANEGKAIAPAAVYFSNVAAEIVSRSMEDAGLSLKEQIAFSDYRLRPGGAQYEPPCGTSPCIKAGPLPGIWASGPYLHNGSVPTIYELLSPESERSDVFWTGSKELDTKHLGYVSKNAPGRFKFDTSIPGNGNQGHNYPKRPLAHDERMALIEYLKTL